jgi:hypothetical protein
MIFSTDGNQPIPFIRGLLDTGAQGSNFVSNTFYQSLSDTHTYQTRHIDRIVRLGDARHVPVQLEVNLNVSISDSKGITHTHLLWCSVLDQLSHDLIIGLVDLIGPFYDVFADAVSSSRTSAINSIGATLHALGDQVQYKPLKSDLQQMICTANTVNDTAQHYQQL